MSVVYAMVGLKGGVGKTATAIGCAVEWAKRGKRVLLVDSDPQMNAVTWHSVARDLGRPVPTVVYMTETLYREDQLPRLAEGFDVCIVDTPPSLESVTRAALMAADVAILPCGPSAQETWRLSATIDLVHVAQQVRPALRARVLVTRKVVGTVLGREAARVLIKGGIDLLHTQLCYRVDYQEASSAGQGPTTYRPAGAASLEIRNLVSELDELMEPTPRKERKAS